MTILVAYDGSPVAAEVLAAAEDVGRAAGWPLRILQVDEAGGAEAATIVWPHVTSAEVVRVGGAAAEAILRAAEAPDVKVVALGLRSDARPGLGHVARELLERTSRMLLLVRQGMLPVDGLRRVLVPLEGSPSTSAAMRVADDAFCRRGREIVMIHVVTGDTPAEPGSMPAPRFMDQEHYEWAAWQEEFCMRFSQCSKGGRHRVCVRVGDPGQLIVAEARDVRAELAVVAWRQDLSPGQAERLKLLLEESPCAVLLVSQASL
jgi:nucleotide-binding universal stress UspA family protein